MLIMKNKVQVSIAMATYNGSKYLQEQLDSFCSQTRQPDELVVCDDGSTDATLAILEVFRQQAPFAVKINRNEKNLGYIKNFEKALSLCEGDIIFLSDQDDVWFSNKIEKVSGVLTLNPSVHILINDQEITDDNLVSSGSTIFKNSMALGYGLDWITSGCCTAITRQFRDLAIPFPVNLIPHDGWLHRIGLMLGIRSELHEVLQFYRRHDQNTSAPVAVIAATKNQRKIFKNVELRDTSKEWAREKALSIFISEHLTNMMKSLNDLKIADRALNAIQYENRKAIALTKRILIIRCGPLGRFFYVTKFLLGGNYRFFSGWKSAAKDLIRHRPIH